MVPINKVATQNVNFFLFEFLSLLTIAGGPRGSFEGVTLDCMLSDFILLLALRSRLRFDFEDLADAGEVPGELNDAVAVLTVDAGERTC